MKDAQSPLLGARIDEIEGVCMSAGPDGVVVSIEQKAQAAWDDYVAARKLAEATLAFKDGRACGLAWCRFIELYLPRDRRQASS